MLETSALLLCQISNMPHAVTVSVEADLFIYFSNTQSVMSMKSEKAAEKCHIIISGALR